MEKGNMDNLHTVTGKFNEALFARMQEWLKKNGMSANQLLSKAVDQYISEPQTLEPVTRQASDREVTDAYDMMAKQHRRALDELK